MKKIKDISKTLEKIDYEKVAKALGATIITKGTKVRMSQSIKRTLIKNGCKKHVDEFGECIGVVEGQVNFGTQKGPEVDVRWAPSHLRYAYHPRELEVLSKEESRVFFIDKTSEDNEYFTETINLTQKYLKISDVELADDIEVSISTIKRWKVGKNLPHKFVRKSVLIYLQRKVIEKQNEYTNYKRILGREIF